MNNQLPQHIAFVLDGNRRWASSQGLSALVGHMSGKDNVFNIVDWCVEKDIEYLTVYAFSTENWRRSKEELDYLFNQVFVQAFNEYVPKLVAKNVKVNIFGDESEFPTKMQEGIQNMVESTKNNTGLVFNICLNYGGRAELVRATRAIIREGIPKDEIDETVIANHLYSAGMPDPDLMIRTGGEHRISGFLLWQQAYTELYFSELGLPGFTKAEFEKALEWYVSRDRHYGK